MSGAGKDNARACVNPHCAIRVKGEMSQKPMKRVAFVAFVVFFYPLRVERER
jgi:hypothetical protein